MKRICVVFLLVVASLASATPDIMRTFLGHYKIAASSKIGQIQCGNCHTTPPSHTPFGQVVHTALDHSGGTLDDKAFTEIEGQTGPNGKPYKQLIHSDLPLNPESEAAAVAKSPIPPHSFHPLVVHFPIALILFAGFAELVGLIRKNADPVRDGVSRWCLWGALASLAPTLPTGWIAHIRADFPLEGATKTHLMLALLTTVFVLFSVYFLRKDARLPYRVFLLLAIAAVALTGHFGSIMVYG